MAPSFVLGSKRSSTYHLREESYLGSSGRAGEKEYASGRFSPAASLDDHFEQPEESVLAAGRLPMKLDGRSRDHPCHLPKQLGEAVPEEEGKPENATSIWGRLSIALIWFITWAIGGMPGGLCGLGRIVDGITHKRRYGWCGWWNICRWTFRSCRRCMCSSL
jgi:hypothetical protein